MLNHFYRSAAHLHYLRTGPLGGDLDALASATHESGYGAQYGRHLISYVDGFVRYAVLSGAGAGPYGTDIINRYRDQLAPCDRLASTKSGFLRKYLRDRGLLRHDVGASPLEEVCDRYEDYLTRVKGLRPSTIGSYRFAALRFLRWMQARRPRFSIAQLTPLDVLVYVRDVAKPSCAREITNHLRSLLRYLHASEGLPRDLARVVPRVPKWKHSTLPEHLPWERVRHLVDAIETVRATGKRDKAIVLLMAGLGLRNGDISRLELKDCQWRKGHIVLRTPKGRRERTLPLTEEVGHALVEYVLKGRPKSKATRVFLTAKAPYGPLKASSMSAMVEKRLSHAKITGVRGATNLLRHSLASHLVNAETPIKNVADLFGHASIDTTAIYTKVDHNSLSRVAMPFPGAVL